MSKIMIKWRKSAIGYNHDQKETIRRLGFRRLNQVIEVEDNPAIRGMLYKVVHLVDVQADVKEGGTA